MRYIKMLVFGIISLLIVVMVISFILPSTGHVEREGVIYAPPSVIFEQLNNLRNNVKWNPWEQTNLKKEIYFFSDPDSGRGAYYSWKSKDPKAGEGRYSILESTGDSTVRFLWSYNRLPSIEGGFIIRPTADGRGCWIKWYMDLPAGWKPWLRFYAVMMDRLVGPGMETGLTNLKSICEEHAAHGN